MIRKGHTKRKSLLTKTLLFLAAGSLLLLGGVPGAVAPESDNALADIQVEFHADDKGFNVTSDKVIAYILIEYCDGSIQMIEVGDFEHTHNDTREIKGIWVKSGAVVLEGPPSLDLGEPLSPFFNAERFDNLGACDSRGSEGPIIVD